MLAKLQALGFDGVGVRELFVDLCDSPDGGAVSRGQLASYYTE